MYWWPFLSSLLQVPTVLIDTYFLDYFVVFFLFLFCFSLFTFFISRLFFPHFDYFVFFCFCFFPSSWLTYLSALLFPNQPTNTLALGLACLQLPQRLPQFCHPSGCHFRTLCGSHPHPSPDPYHHALHSLPVPLLHNTHKDPHRHDCGNERVILPFEN